MIILETKTWKVRLLKNGKYKYVQTIKYDFEPGEENTRPLEYMPWLKNITDERLNAEELLWDHSTKKIKIKYVLDEIPEMDFEYSMKQPQKESLMARIKRVFKRK